MPFVGYAPDLFEDHDTPLYVAYEPGQSLEGLREVDFLPHEWEMLTDDEQGEVHDNNMSVCWRIAEYIVGCVQQAIEASQSESRARTLIQNKLRDEGVVDDLDFVHDPGDEYVAFLKSQGHGTGERALKNFAGDVNNYKVRWLAEAETELVNLKNGREGRFRGGRFQQRQYVQHQVDVKGRDVSESLTFAYANTPKETLDLFSLVSDYEVDYVTDKLVDDLPASTPLVDRDQLRAYLHNGGTLQLKCYLEGIYVADLLPVSELERRALADEARSRAPAPAPLPPPPPPASMQAAGITPYRAAVHAALRAVVASGRQVSPLARALSRLPSFSTDKQVAAVLQEIGLNRDVVPAVLLGVIDTKQNPARRGRPW